MLITPSIEEYDYTDSSSEVEWECGTDPGGARPNQHAATRTQWPQTPLQDIAALPLHFRVKEDGHRCEGRWLVYMYNAQCNRPLMLCAYILCTSLYSCLVWFYCVLGYCYFMFGCVCACTLLHYPLYTVFLPPTHTTPCIECWEWWDSVLHEV